VARGVLYVPPVAGPTGRDDSSLAPSVWEPVAVHEESRKAIIAAFAANVGIAVMKFVGFALTGSASLLAEAGHSLADTGNQGLLMLGGKRASRRPDAKHQFGYGRERYFWSFVVALVLFSAGGLFAIFEGIDKLRHPHQPGDLWVALLVLAGSMVFELYSLTTAMRQSKDDRNGRNWWTYIRDTRTPELPVVLLEDTGALCGLLLATIGIVLAHTTGNARWDAVGSLAIGALLIVIAGVLAVELKGLLIGESATSEKRQAILDAMTRSPSVVRLIHLRTEHIGPDELLVGAKLQFDSSLTIDQLAGVIDEVERRVRAAVPEAGLIYIEPDIAHGAATP
jgi:cation diffusion facilitator family transporter